MPNPPNADIKRKPIEEQLAQALKAIWIDPTKTNNHFGNAPIYGTIRLLL
jgi:hypothetical protein